MAFTRIWVDTSFEPETTTDLPLFCNNSFATNLIALSAVTLLGKAPPAKLFPVMVLYKVINAGPSSDNFTGTRVSALVPVKLIPASNWK
ncbi:hypothetical protein D3C71_1314220 [compost metagenome]